MVGERKTLVVVLLTSVTMVVEISAGLAYGSMALLADGLHMASHAVALGISAFGMEDYCSFHRPHDALDGQTPYERPIEKSKSGGESAKS